MDSSNEARHLSMFPAVVLRVFHDRDKTVPKMNGVDPSTGSRFHGTLWLPKRKGGDDDDEASVQKQRMI
jgi:hypothetical protein